MDSMFAIGISKNNRPYGRYIKQIKVRSCEMLYGDSNVIVGELRKNGDSISIEHVGYDWERNLLEEPDREDIERDTARSEIKRLLDKGASYREISRELNASYSTISSVRKEIDGARLSENTL